MKKNFIYSLAATFITTAVTLGSFTACSNEDMAVDPNVTQGKTYTICIPASMGGGEETRAVEFDNSNTPPTAMSSFLTTDKVYLYNKTSKKWISYNSGTSDFEYLSPDNLTNGGKNCDLTGNITGNISVDDEILLLYNMNQLDEDPANCAYDYRDQDGTANGVLDGAMATVKVKEINGGVITFCQVSDENDETAHFQNLQSMYRFKFTDGTDPINVKRFYVWTDNAYVASSYMPIPPNDADYDGGFVGTSLATATNDYIYMGLYFDPNAGDYDLGFNVTDADGKVYTGSKSAPSGGFQNGRYYYNKNAIELTYQYTLVEPTFTWTTPNVAVEPSFANWYIIPDADADITLSGTSLGYGFWFQQNATVRLNNFTGTYPVTDDTFLYGDGNLTIEVNGTNSIVNANDYVGICTYMGNVKLCGTGTLTITSNDADEYGIDADNYDGTDVSALAATGYTVTRSARTDNDADNDGNPESYTWTYTVRPAYLSATAGDIGKVIGANGIIYDDAAAATAASTTAEAMIAFVDKIDGFCEHGLAISLTDVYEYNATFAEATGDVIISSWATYHPIAGGTWRLPSEADWQRMMWGYYTESPTAIDISTFQSILGVAGGTALVNKAYYWTSTGVDAENAKTVLYDNPIAGIQSVAKTGYYHVRACFSF